MVRRFSGESRLFDLTGIGLDVVVEAAGNDPHVLRMENLDTDLPVPKVALEEGARSLTYDANNSWLPLTGRMELREAISDRLFAQTGHRYKAATEIVITCGGMEGLLNALLATTHAGDEVVVTDPTYAGMINRIRLVGATPVFVPFRIDSGTSEWRLDLDVLRSSISPKTSALFIMNPSMPSGAVLNMEEWNAIAELCISNDLWLIYNAAMERILYDGRAYFHPASLPGMADRTITVGSVSKEFRMIGWKVGWVVGSSRIMADVAKAHVYNTACPVGIAQTAAARAISGGNDEPMPSFKEWERRRDAIVDALYPHYRIVSAAGGWSMLVDISEVGIGSVEASRRLLEKGRIAATYMRDWGNENSDQFIRLVFSDEPVERLSDIKTRFDRAFRD